MGQTALPPRGPSANPNPNPDPNRFLSSGKIEAMTAGGRPGPAATGNLYSPGEKARARAANPGWEKMSWFDQQRALAYDQWAHDPLQHEDPDMWFSNLLNDPEISRIDSREKNFKDALGRALSVDITRISDDEAQAMFMDLEENDPCFGFADDWDGTKMFGAEAGPGRMNLSRLLGIYRGVNPNGLYSREAQDWMDLTEAQKLDYAKEKRSVGRAALQMFDSDEEIIRHRENEIMKRQAKVQFAAQMGALSDFSRQFVLEGLKNGELDERAARLVPEDEIDMALGAFRAASPECDANWWLTQGMLQAWGTLKGMGAGTWRTAKEAYLTSGGRIRAGSRQIAGYEEEQLRRLKLEDAQKAKLPDNLTFGGKMLAGVLGSAPYMAAMSNPFSGTMAVLGMMNDARERMILEGVDPDAALAISIPVGVAQGYIERIQWEGVFGGGLSDFALRRSGIAALGKMLAKGQLRYAGGAVLRMGRETLVTALTEDAEEVLQQISEDAGVQLGKGEFNARELVESAYETAVESFPTTLGFGLARGSGIGPAARRRFSMEAVVQREFGEYVQAKMTALRALEDQERMKSGEFRDPAAPAGAEPAAPSPVPRAEGGPAAPVAGAPAGEGETEGKAGRHERLLNELHRKWRGIKTAKGRIGMLADCGLDPDRAAVVDDFFRLSDSFGEGNRLYTGLTGMESPDGTPQDTVGVLDLPRIMPGVTAATPNGDGTFTLGLRLGDGETAEIRVASVPRGELAGMDFGQLEAQARDAYERDRGRGAVERDFALDDGTFDRDGWERAVRTEFVPNALTRITVEGETIPYAAVVYLAGANLPAGDAGATFVDLGHELFHAATLILKKRGILTDQDIGKLREVFGPPPSPGYLFNEEDAAQAYGEWLADRFADGRAEGVFRKIRDFFRRLFRATRPKPAELTFESVFEAIRQGRLAAELRGHDSGGRRVFEAIRQGRLAGLGSGAETGAPPGNGPGSLSATAAPPPAETGAPPGNGPVKEDGAREPAGGGDRLAAARERLESAKRRGDRGGILKARRALRRAQARGGRYSVSRSQIKSADENTGAFDPSNPDIRYSISPAEMRRSLSEKRKDMSPEEVESNVAELERLDNRTKTNAFLWMKKGTLRLPEDLVLIRKALKIAKDKHFDPQSYDSPGEIINRYATAREGAALIDPDTVEEFSRKEERGNGVVVYTVDDTEEGQKAVREILNNNFGKDFDCWCLAYGNENGGLSTQAWGYWRQYSAANKKIAFKDGKVIAFQADENCTSAAYSDAEQLICDFIDDLDNMTEVAGDAFENAMRLWDGLYDADITEHAHELISFSRDFNRYVSSAEEQVINQLANGEDLDEDDIDWLRRQLDYKMGMLVSDTRQELRHDYGENIGDCITDDGEGFEVEYKGHRLGYVPYGNGDENARWWDLNDEPHETLGEITEHPPHDNSGEGRFSGGWRRDIPAEDIVSVAYAHSILDGGKMSEGGVRRRIAGLGGDPGKARDVIAKGERIAAEEKERVAGAVLGRAASSRVMRGKMDEMRRGRIISAAAGVGRFGYRLGREDGRDARRLADEYERRARALTASAKGFGASDMEGKYGFDICDTVLESRRAEKVARAKPAAETAEEYGEPILPEEPETEPAEPPEEPAPESAKLAGIRDRARARADAIDAKFGLEGGTSPAQKKKNAETRALNEADEAGAKAGGAAEEEEGSEAGTGEEEAPPAIHRERLDFTRASDFIAFCEEIVETELRGRGDLKEGQDPWESPVHRRELVNTARRWLRKIATGLCHSRGRELILRDIDMMDKACSLDAIEAAAMNCYARIQERLITESQRELVRGLEREGKRLAEKGGRFKRGGDERGRKVRAEVEYWWRNIKRYFRLTPEGIRAELDELQKIIDRRGAAAESDPGYDIRNDLEWRRATDLKAALCMYGGLINMRPAQIEAISEDILRQLRGSREELENAREDRRIRTQTISVALQRAISNPVADRDRRKPRPGMTASALDSMTGILGLRLRDLIRFSRGGVRARAEAYLQNVEDSISLASQGRNVYRQRQDEALRSALEEIYGSAADGLRRLYEPLDDEDRRALTKQGADEINRSWLLQRYAELLQADDYAVNIAVSKRDGEWREAFDRVFGERIDGRDLRLLSWIRDWYRRNLDEINEKVLVPITGTRQYSPGENYFPVKMKTRERRGFGAAAKTWSPLPDWLTPRVHNQLDFDESTDLVTMWRRRMDDSARSISYARLGVELCDIFLNPEMKKAISDNHGDLALRRLSDHLMDIANGGGAAQGPRDDSLALADKLRAWQTNIALSWNYAPAFKQMFSAPVFALRHDISFGKLVRFMTDVDAGAIRALIESDGWKSRYGSGMSEEIANAMRENAGRGKSPVANIAAKLYGSGFGLLEIGDSVPGLWVGQGLYRYFAARIRDVEGGGARMSEPEIRELALARTWAVVESTQQSSRAENLTAIQRGGNGSAGRLFYQFVSSSVQQLAYETQALREVLGQAKAYGWGGVEKSSKDHLIRALVVNHVIMPVAMQLAAVLAGLPLGSVPDRDELLWETLAAMLLGPFGCVVIAGAVGERAVDALLTGKKEFGGGDGLPVMGIAGLFSDLGVTAHDLMALKTEDLQGDIVRTLSSLSAPARQGVKAYENYTDKRKIKRREKAIKSWGR